MRTANWLIVVASLPLAACPSRREVPATTTATSTALSSATSTATAPAKPARNFYALDLPLLDDHGAHIRLDVSRGHPTLVAMFYSTCPRACPLLISDLVRVEQLLSVGARAQLRVLLISFDPDNDTPEALLGVRSKRGLDPDRWRLTVASEDDARTIGAALGVRYRAENGGFLHSSVITLIDRNGRIDARAETGEEGEREGLATLAARVEVLAAAR